MSHGHHAGSDTAAVDSETTQGPAGRIRCKLLTMGAISFTWPRGTTSRASSPSARPTLTRRGLGGSKLSIPRYSQAEGRSELFGWDRRRQAAD
jgi:hypothetical protein